MKGLLDFLNFGPVIVDVSIALTPLFIIFVFFQFLFLRRPKEFCRNILIGFLLSFIGLILFLQGVKVGFLPVGFQIGELLAQINSKWIIIPIGFFLGLVATLAEPAVRIMSYEVEKVSTGVIPARVIIATLSIGVGLFVALGMVRILFGIPFYYIIIPGYILALILLKFSDPIFMAIAFDSGGVATGPMTVTIIMAMAVGLARSMENRDAVVDGFGLIALVALAPIISILIFGLIYMAKRGDKK